LIFSDTQLKKARIAVLVSGGGTNLQALLDAEKSGCIPSGQIVLVVSNKSGVFALTRAAEAGVENLVIPGTDPAFESKLSAALRERGVEMIVLAGFLRILSRSFTAAWPERIINIHPSLIPAFCGEGFYGLHVHEAVLAAGAPVTGATVHFVNEIPDGGRIILQKQVAVQPGDTPEILQQRVLREAEWVLLPQAAELVAHEIVGKRKKQ
jgi:phosphoribosylglycinamide formyltransferase, formyltetrahydrofolate-dependent